MHVCNFLILLNQCYHKTNVSLWLFVKHKKPAGAISASRFFYDKRMEYLFRVQYFFNSFLHILQMITGHFIGGSG